MPMTTCGECGKECFISDHTKDCGGEVYCEACANKTSVVRVVPEPKMTLRDTFAMAALTGLLADEELDGNPVKFSQLAYRYADAMLLARKS